MSTSALSMPGWGAVIPAQAGIHHRDLDSRLRGTDESLNQ
jgi:hypothetical protein